MQKSINPYETDGEKIAFEEGIKAFYDHISIDQNPYPENNLWNTAWTQGYNKVLCDSFKVIS